MNRALLLILLRGFGTGYTPGMPGTAGSLFAFLLTIPVWIYRQRIGVIPAASTLVVLAIFTGFLTWIGFRSCQDEWEEFDPSEIVLDEFTGTFLITGVTSMLGQHVWIFIGFVLFRFFDMLKPFPIRIIEHADRYAGLVLDDVAAAAMAGLTTASIWIII
jgi:phosphatidylglycerophosphatase A